MHFSSLPTTKNKFGAYAYNMWHWQAIVLDLKQPWNICLQGNSDVCTKLNSVIVIWKLPFNFLFSSFDFPSALME